MKHCMRKTLRKIVVNLGGKIRSPKSGIHLMNSHCLPLDFSQEEFAASIEKLSKIFQFINFEEAVTLIEKKTQVNQSLMAFSYDDGFEDNYTKIAPVLESYNVNACFFINPGFISGDRDYKKKFVNKIVNNPGHGAMSWEQVRELHQRGHVIGNHTYNHVDLGTLSPCRFDSEILASKLEIENRIASNVDYFAWPFGREVHITQEALDYVLTTHKFAFSGTDFKKYFFNSNHNVLNRRHFEGDWPLNNIKFFTSFSRRYD